MQSQITFIITELLQDETVEEYDFSKELEDEEDEDDGCETATLKNSTEIITISDDEESQDEVAIFQPDQRPWLQSGFSVEARRQYEVMYSTLTDYPMGRERDWEITEEYMREKDKEMIKYVSFLLVSKQVLTLPPQVYGGLPASTLGDTSTGSTRGLRSSH